MRKLIGYTMMQFAFVGTAGFAAEGPTAAQLLGVQPAQPGVAIDMPERAEIERCVVETVANPAGWIVRDSRGVVLRRFVASAGTSIDRWSFFANGQEVYRDLDTNQNRRPDQCRWFHAGGSRWGVDQNEDGTIDYWKSISAEEVTAEIVAAAARGDMAQANRVLLTEQDARALGLNEEAQARCRTAAAAAPKKMQALAAALGKEARWTGFDGDQPMAIPAEEVGGQDLVCYQNATIIAEAGSKTLWLRAAEIVKVGDTWKLSEVPNLIEPDRPLEIAGVVIPPISTASAAAPAAPPTEDGMMIEDNEDARKLAAALQQHDQALPNDPGNGKAMAAYHVKRADLCARIAAASTKLGNREFWYKQTADSINAAVQTGEYPQGVTTLAQYAGQFAKTTWGKNLAAYFEYRSINAAYSLTLTDEKADHVKSQEEFLAGLNRFLTQYADAEDAPDALLQLGHNMEFAGKEDEAKGFYQQLVSKFPKSDVSAKAQGALRRLTSDGQPFQLAGGSLGSVPGVDTRQFRGKVLVINYWATWCEPCKAEMPRLQKLREKYGKDLEVIGVCVDNDRQAAEAFLRQTRYAWPQIFEQGAMESTPVVQYGVISLPYMMLVDGDGRVLNRNLQFNELETEVDKAMTKKVASKP